MTANVLVNFTVLSYNAFGSLNFSMSKAKIIVLILFFSLVVLLVGIWWFYRQNVTSRGDLFLELIAPEQVVVGQPVEYTLRLKNQGNFTLTNAELMFEFPRSARLIEPGDSIVRQKLDDSIYPGQEQQFAFRAKIFGQEKEILTAKARVDYQIQGLRANYTAETSAATAISSVPITFELSLPQTAAPGREFQFSLNYFSALGENLENVGMKLSATRGFELKESVPRTDEPGEWKLPFLVSQDGGRIRLIGWAGTGVPEVVFSAQIGVWTEWGFFPIKITSRKIEVSDAPLHLSLQTNNSFDYVANAGDSLHYQLFFRNVTERPLEKQFLTVSLKGDYFDLKSLRSIRGIYQPGHNSILWDWRDIPQLRFLDRDEEGMVDFWIDLKDDWPIRSFSPQAEIEVEIGSVRQTFANKVNSKLGLVQRAYAGDEFFDDVGSIPLRLGELTRYSVYWELTNQYNVVEDIWVAVNLPSEVVFADKVFPEEETGKISFEPEERRLVWSAGRLEPGQKAVLAFQLAVHPLSAESLISPLIGQAEVQGWDQWTERVIVVTVPEVVNISQMPEEGPFN